MVQELTAIIGRPTFGTCFDENEGAERKQCMDSIPPSFGPKRTMPLSQILRLIAARGPDRVRLNKGVTLDQACAACDLREPVRAGAP